MTTTTARYGLPLLVPGQAQKEMFHNEAVAAIDALIGAVVEAVGTDAPPAAPAEGQSWIVGPAPTEAWAGQAGRMASWTAGGWRFQRAIAGMEVTEHASGLRVRFDGTAWRTGEVRAAALLVGGIQVVGAQGAAIAAPGGGATVDTESRAAIGAILEAMRTHGLIG